MDMFERMLNGLVDHLLTQTGMTKEGIQAQVKQFVDYGKYADGALRRIEHNQQLLIEAENGRRAELGLGPLSGLYSDNGGDGRNITGGH